MSKNPVETEAQKIKDTSREVDIFGAVMNLSNLEEHLAFTIGETQNPEYLHIYNQVRKLRACLLQKITTNKDSEAWCMGKHIVAATQRLIEVASKSDEKEALEFMENAKELRELFFAIQSIQ